MRNVSAPDSPLLGALLHFAFISCFLNDATGPIEIKRRQAYGQLSIKLIGSDLFVPRINSVAEARRPARSRSCCVSSCNLMLCYAFLSERG
jgi:hypothetical protein